MSLYFRLRSNLLSLHQKLIYRFLTIFHFITILILNSSNLDLMLRYIYKLDEILYFLVKPTFFPIHKDMPYLINPSNHFIIYNFLFLILFNYQHLLN
jgi:hypothetical protein